MSDDFFDKLTDYQEIPFQHLKGCPGGPPMVLFGGTQICNTCQVANHAYELGRKEMEEEYTPILEALCWYADPEFYHAVGFWFDPPCGGFDEDFSSDHGNDFYRRDMPGKLARQAIATFEGGTDAVLHGGP
jgi:hypothetical protein